MAATVSMEGAGVRFRVPRRSRLGKTPRLFGLRKWKLWGLRDVNLQVAAGEVVGLVGPNGAGKSTLLRMASGIYPPDEGRVEVQGRVTPFLTPSAGLVKELSGWENIRLGGVLLGYSRAEADAIAPRVAEFSGLGSFLDAPIRTYSAGMMVRLGFALVAFAEPDVLVVDEALGAGDEDFRKQSQERMRELISAGHTVLLATHSLAYLKELCHRVVRLEDGQVTEIGEPSSVLEHYLDDLRRAGRHGELRRLEGGGPPHGQRRPGAPS